MYRTYHPANEMRISETLILESDIRLHICPCGSYEGQSEAYVDASGFPTGIADSPAGCQVDFGGRGSIPADCPEREFVAGEQRILSITVGRVMWTSAVLGT